MDGVAPHARGDPRRPRRRRHPAALDRERVGPGSDRDHLQPDRGPRGGRRDDPLPQHGAGGLRAPRPARDVHVLADASELLPERLAPARVARRDRERPATSSPTTSELLSPIGRQFVAGLLDHAREMAVFGDPTTNALRALPPVLVRARPDLLGGGQPRRADPRPGRPGRRRHARREPALGAGREPVPLAGRERRRGPRRHRARRRAAAADRRRPVRGRGAAPAAVARRGRRRARGLELLPRARSATRSSTTS